MLSGYIGLFISLAATLSLFLDSDLGLEEILLSDSALLPLMYLFYLSLGFALVFGFCSLRPEVGIIIIMDYMLLYIYIYVFFTRFLGLIAGFRKIQGPPAFLPKVLCSARNVDKSRPS